MSVRVSLAKIVDAFDEQSEESTSHLNIKTGKIVTVMGEYKLAVEDGVDLSDETDWLRDEVETAADVMESDDYLTLPTQFDIHEYRIIERFCLSLDDDDLRDQMLNAISGRGAFRMFKDGIHRHNIADDWYRYRQAAFREIAIEWCQRNGLEYDE